MTKAFYDKSVPTRNLITTISGIVTLIITIMVQFGVFTPDQAGQVTQHTTTLLTVIPQVISAVAGLILVFKAKDV
jgi:hypothetical protein